MRKRKKNQTSVQQTFNWKAVTKWCLKALFAQCIREVLSYVFHTEEVSALWSMLKAILSRRP